MVSILFLPSMLCLEEILLLPLTMSTCSASTLRLTSASTGMSITSVPVASIVFARCDESGGHLTSSQALVHALVSTRVDYWNSVLAAAPKTTTDKLQRVLNAAARVVSSTRKFDRGLSQLMVGLRDGRRSKTTTSCHSPWHPFWPL